MDLFEELVLWHLTRKGDVFVCPQYEIDGGWSCPDFVALNPKKKTVSVVEVSAASSPNGLLKKVRERENQWFGKLRAQLLKLGIIDNSWGPFQAELYVRDTVAKQMRTKFNEEDIMIKSLEEIGFPWKWDWPSKKAAKEAEEMKSGLENQV